jgi:hypothetical protein
MPLAHWTALLQVVPFVSWGEQNEVDPLQK